MFIYLMHIPQGSCKLGLTTRFPIYRLNEYRTRDDRDKIYATAYMPSIANVSALEDIERNCLVATAAYNDNLKERPHSECRYGIEPDKLWEMCRPYFPADAVEYFGSHAERLTTQDCPTVKPTAHCAEPEPRRDLFRSYAEFMAHKLPHITARPDTAESYAAVEQIMPENAEHRAAVVLRGYQPTAYAELLHAMSTYGIATLNIMCRCGKTELFKKYAVDFQDAYEIIVYCAPRLPLITEIIRRFEGHLPNYEILELSSQNSRYAVRDDAYKIAELSDKRCLIFVCDKSFARVIPYISTGRPTLVIFDEAHYLCREKTTKHPLLLIVQHKPNIKQIFATATPIVGNYLTKNIAYMNDPALYGPPESVIKFNDIAAAIEQQFMTPAVIIVASRAARPAFLTGDILCNKRLTLAISLFESIRRNTQRMKTLFYCSNINSVTATVAALTACYAGVLKIFCCHSKMDDKKSATELDNFRNCQEPCVLVNCRMVTDGINIVDIDTVVYVDPKYTKAEIIQTSMRPRSYMPNKLAYIIVPCCMAGNTIDDKQFETVIDLLRELHVSNDPTVRQFCEASIAVAERKTAVRTMTPLVANVMVPNTEYVQIDEHIKPRIIELTGQALKPRRMTMDDCIMDVLADDQPRIVTQIWEEIERRGTYITYGKTPRDTCSSACYRLYMAGKLGRTEDVPHKYYVIRNPVRRNIAEFLDELQTLGIRSEQAYRTYFSTEYTEDFPENPAQRYSQFTWDMLGPVCTTPYATREECCRAISAALLKDPTLYNNLKHFGCDTAKKLELLHDVDQRIPCDIMTAYKCATHELHRCLIPTRNTLLE